MKKPLNYDEVGKSRPPHSTYKLLCLFPCNITCRRRVAAHDKGSVSSNTRREKLLSCPLEENRRQVNRQHFTQFYPGTPKAEKLRESWRGAEHKCKWKHTDVASEAHLHELNINQIQFGNGAALSSISFQLSIRDLRAGVLLSCVKPLHAVLCTKRHLLLSYLAKQVSDYSHPTGFSLWSCQNCSGMTWQLNQSGAFCASFLEVFMPRPDRAWSTLIW